MIQRLCQYLDKYAFRERATRIKWDFRQVRNFVGYRLG
ncbi:hypothetical protein T11_3356 [Trichinella zimbabwensis]|uniref:Uncharacterized protein n=1 Tax=Trichinella zimbabwensis TaxID=268475 RepID=A0A0V1G904_9BILA|nr:hypothetical protein T11_3356 [Trichinella zimbabwensis]